ncbi:MAG: ERF family protein [Pikeienuella sp.]
MNAVTKVETTDAVAAPHQGIAVALAVAQAKMGKALKSSQNPHFKSKYADLASVVDACMPALNECGIAVIQPTTDDEGGRFVETILIHGESGEQLSCRVPLIIQKNDMQGYGSAVTYARRYGLMSMAGIAPEDDDGNAAATAAPKAAATVTPDQFIKLRDLMESAGVEEEKLLASYNAPSLQQFPAEKFNNAMSRLQATIDEKSGPRNADLDGDEIPQNEDA